MVKIYKWVDLKLQQRSIQTHRVDGDNLRDIVPKISYPDRWKTTRNEWRTDT
jgi:adenylylsulfate kinase-like enzyme